MRIWIYLTIALVGVVYTWQSENHGLVVFVIVAVVMPLPYLEWCRMCRKIVWLEKGNRLGPLWIGRECKDQGDRR
jgi:hypothetical protein